MIAKKPPMGWNSWNTFGKNINESLICQIADTMVEKGYRDAGYEYLIIDDCWSLKERDASGQLPYDCRALSGRDHVCNRKCGRRR